MERVEYNQSREQKKISKLWAIFLKKIHKWKQDIIFLKKYSGKKNELFKIKK